MARTEHDETLDVVEEICRDNDLGRLWDPGIIECFGVLPIGMWVSARDRLHKHFGPRLLVADLDKAVRSARSEEAALSRPAAEPVPIRGVLEEERETIAAAEDAILCADIQAVYELAPALARLGEVPWIVLRARLHRRFGAGLQVRTLDRHIAAAQLRPAVEAAISAPAAGWDGFLGALRAAFGAGPAAEWFTARQVAELIRSGAIAELPWEMADVDQQRPGSLERSIGRRLAGRAARAHVQRGRDAHRDTMRWRML